ncbi:LacI family DNA-binding transcriptional regulator [Mycolicibacterium sp. 624]|uniref:LacI family DNA-binding transcriptional regulator n=1 Tax=Mycolicibacterium sp. 624 TaxID=3156314 RepID=UPI003391CE74
MTQRRVTIRDVAAEAKVSIATVSLTLNGKGELDRNTRARVLKIAERLGYRANPAARALREGKFGTLGLTIPTFGAHPGAEIISLDYYMQLAAGAAGAALDADRPLTLVPARDDGSTVTRLRVDGLIVCDPTTDDPYVAACRNNGIAVVTVESDLAHPEDPWHVNADNNADTRLLLDHLWDAGARNIAMIAPEPIWAWVQESRDAYIAWSAERGNPPRIEHAALEHLEASARETATRLLSRPDRPDAVLTVADRHADGVARAARDLGYQIPQDLLLASGIDNRNLEVNDPSITALDLRPALRGATAAKLLLGMIDGADVSGPVIIPGILRARSSTTPVRRKAVRKRSTSRK